MQHRHRRGGHRRTGLGFGFGFLIIVVALAGMLTACGGGSAGPQVASLGSVSTTTAVSSATGTGKGKGDPLAFSKCMRAHGVPDFPDPDTNGGITINSGGPGGNNLGPDSPAFTAAQKACESLAPGGGTLTPAEKANMRARGLEMAKCMRAHGILDFPDPNPDGGIAIEAKPGSDLAPDSPTFQAAQKACMPNGPGGKGSTHISGGSTSGSGT